MVSCVCTIKYMQYDSTSVNCWLPLVPFHPGGIDRLRALAPGVVDYPYFGAERSNSRIHAGIDVYPPAGDGASLRAIKDGTVIKVGLFYTRYTGEKTYAVLVDHGDFVANYAEVRPPALVAGSTLNMGDLVGYISGTRQLHFEMYTPGTTDWLWWYGEQPENLLDPTQMMLKLYDLD